MQDYQVLLDVVRQNFASVVWTHKIQEKQADIYADRYKLLETINVVVAALTSCGVVSLVTDQECMFVKVVTCILSFATLAITAYFKSFDLKSLEKQHKDAANNFIVIRNELLQVIADIHMKNDSVQDINERYQEIMAVAAKVGGFDTFCDNIELDNYEEMKTSAGEIAKKLNKVYYSLDADSSSHLYIVGSVGRKTAIKGSSDLDIIFNLPTSTYKKFDAYQSNGQSSLLQEVKGYLQERYPRTTISGDGQVVVIEFNKYTVELVPGFKQSDDRFKYPDTHDGGSWKYTDPIPEQEECQNCENESNNNYFNFCHILRSWKNTQGFKFGGLLIDTLVYDHFKDNECYENSTRDDYLDILKNLLAYLGEQDKDRVFWYAVGSNQQVQNSGNGIFVTKANAALKKINDAEDNGDDVDEVLQELLGTEYPVEQKIIEKAAYKMSAFSNTEQFIQELFPVDIRYNLSLDCHVRQNGFRDRLLSTILHERSWLRRNKQLEFFIKETDCPKPYSIYWKIRNVGPEAEKRNCVSV